MALQNEDLNKGKKEAKKHPLLDEEKYSDEEMKTLLKKYWRTPTSLRKRFKTMGSFYNVNDNELFECRNIVEIVRSETDVRKLDALIIMVNPGSSHPKDYAPKSYTCDEIKIGLKKDEFVEADPDKTEYQIMRLMQVKKWNRVRILNLSDIRCSNIDEFKVRYKEMENSSFDRIHSIFSTSRTKEKEIYADIEVETPVILAWGKIGFIIDLANEVCRYFSRHKIIGIQSEDGRNLYYHPSPKGKSRKYLMLWIKAIDEMIG